MTDRENVIKALEEAIQHYERYSGDEYGREYDFARVEVETLEDAIVLLKEDERAIKHQSDHLDALLKAQEPRIVTEADFNNADPYGYLPVWVEDKDDNEIICDCITKHAITEPDEDYHYRYWTSRPTDAQREAVPWLST